jgi:putative ABC transport system permease protein
MRKAITFYIRGIKRSQLSFIINLIGMASGLACTFLIYLWVRDEMSVDTFHKNDAHLYQVLNWRKGSDGAITVKTPTPPVMADYLAEKVPSIKNAVTVVNSIRTSTLVNGDKALKAKGIYTAKDFFKLFSFDLLEGQEKSLLSDLGNIVLSEELALKLFGTNKNIIGKVLNFDRKEQFVVSGVVKVPANSTIRFDYILSLPIYTKHTGYKLDWNDNFGPTYILLKDNTGINTVNSQLLGLMEKAGADIKKQKIFAAPFSEGYLYGNYENGVQSGGRIDYVKLFSITGIIILLIACINFVSLSTAMATGRMKEVGMKKILGANRRSIIAQHMGESIMLAFISLLLSILIVVLLLPAFNTVAEKHIELHWSIDTVLAFLGITLLTGLLAGIYPAIYISRFKPMMIKDNSASALGKQGVRKALVITQFAVSVILILFTIVVYKQFTMIQNRNLGYNKDNVVYFNMDGNVVGQRESFIAGLKQLPGVQQASAVYALQTNTSFFGTMGSAGDLDWPGKKKEEMVIMNWRNVDYDMVELLDMKMKEGRTFSKKYTTDVGQVIFNEAAIKAMGLKNPVGKEVLIWKDPYEIIGVVKDFYIASIHNGNVKPLFMVRQPSEFNTIMVKVKGEELNSTLKRIETFHSHFNPGFPFEYKFMDQDFQALYSSERKVSVLSGYFAVLAILISCLGLLGLTAFTVDKRKKEIGTRRVLGAEAIQIVWMLYKDISKPVLIALLLGLPVGYMLTHKWLESFAIRIALESWFFVVAGGISLTLMLIASGIHVIKALSISPAESLRKE